MTRLRFGFLSLLAVILVTTPGCLFRTRTASLRMSTAHLENATQQELIAKVNNDAAKLHTLNASVNIATSTGGSTKGKITEYEEIKGYLLVRQPDMLRMIGLLPVVRSKAFDMVSDGKEFKLSIPPKNEFVVGHNAVSTPSNNALENLRPQAIYSALLLHEINPANEIAVLESSTEHVVDPKTKKVALQPNYILDVIKKEDGDWYLARKIIFDRTDLLPHRQLIFDKKGYVLTDATYSNFKDYNGIEFPSVIQIWRPEEEYRISLVIEKLTINQPLKDDQFALQQPPGSQLVNLDEQKQSASSGAALATAADAQHNPGTSPPQH